MDPILSTEFKTIQIMRYGSDRAEWTFRVSVQPPVRSGRTRVFPTHATLGPTDPDVGDTLTTVNFMDLSAGAGIYTINPSKDLNNYWWGIASASGTDGWTQAPEAIMRQPGTYTGNCVPLGRIGVSTYALWGTQIHLWDPDAQTWGNSLGTIGTVVNTEGIVTFNGRMYFPLGSSGYSSVGESAPGTLTAITTVAGAATPTYTTPPGSPSSNPRVWAFAVHLDMLWALTTAAEGHALVSSLTGASASWQWKGFADSARGDYVKMDTSFEPKALAVFPNAQSGESLWASGRRGLKVYDDGNMRWKDTTLVNVPPHPDFGRAMQVFRPGEALWIAAGGGDVIQYTAGGNVVPASGPGGARDGMPAGKRGSAVSFATDLAYLYGLFHGQAAESAAASIVEDSEGGDPIYIPGATAVTSVIRNSGKGWHPIWESATTGGTPTKIVVSDAVKDDGSVDYRAFWGLGEECWTIQCRLTTHSAVQAIQTDVGERFRSTAAAEGYRESYLEWGRFNGGAIAIHKLASHAALLMEHATATEYVEYQYYTDHDHDGTWVTLGAATTDAGDGDPRVVLPFGITDDEQFSRGEANHWIRQRLRFVGASATRPPIVTAMTLAYLPLPQDAATKAYTLPLPAGICPDTGQTAEQIINKLESLISETDDEPEFLFLQDGQRIYRSWISSIAYARAPTAQTPGALNLTVIQIPSGLPTLIGEA